MNTKMSNKLLPILFIAVTGKIFFGSYAISSSYRNSLTDSSIVESTRISHSVGGPTGVKNTYISRDCNAEALSVFQSVLPGLSPYRVIDKDRSVPFDVCQTSEYVKNWNNILLTSRPLAKSPIVVVKRNAKVSAVGNLEIQNPGAKAVKESSLEELQENLLRDSVYLANEVASAPLSRAAGCVPESAEKKTVSLLLIGNSLTRKVQSKLRELLLCGGYKPKLATSASPGFWLHEHLINERTLELIAKGYDLTLLQEKSRGITTHNAPYHVLNDLQKKIEAAGSRMGFYQTWGFSNRNLKVTESILSHYEYLAVQFDAPIVHIGRAWDYFYSSNNEAPPFSLFSDTVHASEHGQAFIAYVLYAYLTGDSPVNLTPLTLDKKEATELQSIAWAIYHFNSSE